MLTPLSLAVLVFGAFLGGFVSGLAGFAYALVTLGIWLHVTDPGVAVPLLVAMSLGAQLWAIAKLRRGFDLRRSWPFMVAGGLGVPLGIRLLGVLPATGVKMSLGILMLCYVAAMALLRPDPFFEVRSRLPDAAIGFAGGILGGLAGLSGVLPSIWVQLRGWSKDVQRGVFQPYILVTQSFALAGFLLDGAYGRRAFLVPAGPCLVATFAGTWLGLRLYARLDDRRFRHVVLALIGLSGLALVIQGHPG